MGVSGRRAVQAVLLVGAWLVVMVSLGGAEDAALAVTLGGGWLPTVTLVIATVMAVRGRLWWAVSAGSAALLLGLIFTEGNAIWGWFAAAVLVVGAAWAFPQDAPERAQT